MKTGKILKKKKVFKGSIFDVWDFEVEVDGQKIKRQMLGESNGIVVVPVDEEGKVWLVEEYFIGPNKKMLGLVGGKTFAEDDEEIEAEAQRELQEEIGMRAKRMIKVNKSYVEPWKSNRVGSLFLALGLEPSKLKGDDDEILEVVKMPLDEAIKKAKKDFTIACHEVGFLMMVKEKLEAIRKK